MTVEQNSQDPANPVEPTEEIDYKARYEESQRKEQELAEQLKNSATTNEQVVQRLEQMLTTAFNVAGQQVTRPVPTPEPEPEWDAMDPEAQRRATEHMIGKYVGASNKVVGSVISEMRAEQVDERLEYLEAKFPDAWGKVGKQVKEFFAKNPQEKARGKNVADQVFKYFWGEAALTAPSPTQPNPPGTNVQHVNTHTPAPVGRQTPTNKEKEIELTPEEAIAAKKLRMDPAKYAAYRDGVEGIPRNLQNEATEMYFTGKNKRRLW